MDKFIQLLEFIDNQTLIIFALSVIAVALVHAGDCEQIVNSIVSGLLGMGMGKLLK